MRGRAGLSGLICLAAVSGSSAQETARRDRFDDWEVACPPSVPPDAAKGAAGCKAYQRLAAKGEDRTVFALTVVHGGDGAAVAIVSIPLGGYIAPGIEMSVDGRKPYKLLVETCNQAGCHAGFPVSGKLEKELRAGKAVRFRTWTAKDRPADVTVSLHGFSDALTALERRS